MAVDKKQEELQKMYALRAGLSIISQKCDKLENDNRCVQKMKTEVMQLKKPDYMGKTMYDVDKYVDDLKNYANTMAVSYSKKLVGLCKNLKEDKGNRLVFPFVRSVAVSWHEIISDCADDVDQGVIMVLGSCLMGYLLLVPILVFVMVFDFIAFPFRLFRPSRIKRKRLLKAIRRDKNFKEIQRYGYANCKYSEYAADIVCGEALTELVDILKNSDYKFKKLGNILIKHYNMLTPSAIVHLQHLSKMAEEENKKIGYEEVEQHRKEYQQQCANFEKLQKEKRLQFEKKVENNQQLTLLISAESQVITNILKSSYSKILDIRDWENLDLVIYYYETGRADSIKEALQLVDLERRNNNLMNCIQQASNEISSSIKTGISKLGSAMIQGFESLSAQIDAQRVQIIDALNGLKSLNSKVNKNLVEISTELNKSISQQQLSNALLAKANVSSKQMVEQMKTLNNKIKSA